MVQIALLIQSLHAGLQSECRKRASADFGAEKQRWNETKRAGAKPARESLDLNSG
jgi:hypothetical protein